MEYMINCFVISQVRWIGLIQPEEFTILSASEILFAISKCSNPTLDEDDWCKFSFAGSVPGLFPFPPDIELRNSDSTLQLSYDKNAYYIGEFSEVVLQRMQTNIVNVYGIRKDKIRCCRDLPVKKLLSITLPDNDTTSHISVITFAQMLSSNDYIYFLYHLDGQPLTLYKISINKVRFRTLPITLNKAGRGTAVSRNDKLWLTYELSSEVGNSSVIWYEINNKTLAIIQSGTIVNADYNLRFPSIMIDKDNNMLLSLALVNNNIWSLGYTYRKANDALTTTRELSFISRGSQPVEVPQLQTLMPWSSLDPCNERVIYSHGGYSERTGNWKSIVFNFQV